MNQRAKNLILCITLLVGTIAGPLAKEARADDQLRKVQREFNDRIKPILVENCFDCHSGNDPDAAFSLEGFNTLDQLLNARKKWKKVEVRVAAKEMPPEDFGSMDDADHKTVMTWLDKLFNSVDCTTVNPGRITIRRLNRTEYRNTVRDLLGVDYEPADMFPGDDVGYGFDNIADVLSLPPILMEKYIDAAEAITDQAIIDPNEARFHATMLGSQFRKSGGTHPQDLIHVMSSNATIRNEINTPLAGKYKVSVRAYGTPSDNEWPKMTVGTKGKTAATRKVNSTKDEPGDYEFTVRLKEGKQDLEISFLNDHYVENVSDRNLFIVHANVSGPFNGPSKAQRTLIGETPSEREKQSVLARKVINSFASKAYRRRAYSSEIKRLMELYELQRSEGESHEMALKYTFQAVLVSPFFLYKVEIPTKPGQLRQLSEFELATSLSYFMWSSMPDSELFKLAASKRLKKGDTYRQQVVRMLKDPKSAALIDNFVTQWLQLGHLEHVKPDPDLFPGVDEQLRKDMATETKMVIADIIRRDGSVMDLLETEYSYLNERLAKHYGMRGVKGDSFRRVSVEKIGRVGILTHASVLTLTSNPNRTSPVKRGKWIMENMLGEEPPPPDPDAMGLEDQQELVGTLRQRMEQHRANPSCAVCHLVMDELGFALENYDAVGKWRDKDESNTIDARGELPDGTVFEGPKQLQQTLKTKMKEQFARCLTEKMLIYALGRGLEYFDECTIDKILAKAKKDNYRFSSLIMAVATSEPFLKRKGAPVISED